MGASVGTLVSLAAATMKSRTAAQGIGSNFSALAINVIPTTTSAAIIYTLASSIAREVRGGGAYDWKNEFIGGACAGAVLNGVKKRSLQSAFLGALGFGCLGASVGLFSMMQPDSTNQNSKLDKRSLVTRPADFGRAGATSASTASKLV